MGTSKRQKAARITQIEILPQPPADCNPATPWPAYPNVLKTSSSHLEGCERYWSLATKRFVGKNGQLAGVEVAEVEWTASPEGKFDMKETGKTRIIPADLVFLSMGFEHPVHEGLLDDLGVQYDARGNVAAMTPNRSSVTKVFVAGDITLGASLVVRAIDSGRKAANEIERFFAAEEKMW